MHIDLQSSKELVKTMHKTGQNILQQSICRTSEGFKGPTYRWVFPFMGFKRRRGLFARAIIWSLLSTD